MLGLFCLLNRLYFTITEVFPMSQVYLGYKFYYTWDINSIKVNKYKNIENFSFPDTQNPLIA